VSNHDSPAATGRSGTPSAVTLGAADVILLTGEQAWNLPIDYVAHGGKASDHHSDNPHYHWRKRPELLESMLREHLATPERWLDQFDQTAIPAPPDDLGGQ